MSKAFALLGVLLLLIGSVGASAVSDVDITILLSSDTRGHLETCRCRHGQLGGLPRRATVFLGKDSPAPRLMLDAGNVIKGVSVYDRSKLQYILAGMWAMGYDAMNLGRMEAALGRDELRSLAKSTQFPLLSCNILDSASKRTVVPAYTVIRVGDCSIGIVGVADVPVHQVGAGLTVVPAEDALARTLPEVRRKSQVVLVLASVSDARLVSLAERFQDVTCMLGGDTESPWDDARKVGRVTAFAVGENGSVVGRMRARWTAGSGFRVQRVEALSLPESVPDHPALAQVVQAFKNGKDRSLQPGRPTATAAPPGEDRVAGTNACRSCHMQAYRVWAGSKHARSLISLKKRGYDKDAECLACHTTAMGAADGYVNQQQTLSLANVGCEMCHGRASTHVRSGGRSPTIQPGDSLPPRFPAVASKTCAKCHTPEHSNFEYDAYWARIRH